jgi:uncharacterized protein YukE
MSGSSSSGSTSTSMVPNPMHEALAQLYSKLQGDAATMSNALKPANQQMAAGGTWVGTTAQSWGSQLDGHSGDCATQVNAMLADVSQALAAEPAQVTMTEAQEKAKMMSMMERGY